MRRERGRETDSHLLTTVPELQVLTNLTAHNASIFAENAKVGAFDRMRAPGSACFTRAHVPVCCVCLTHDVYFILWSSANEPRPFGTRKRLCVGCFGGKRRLGVRRRWWGRETRRVSAAHRSARAALWGACQRVRASAPRQHSTHTPDAAPPCEVRRRH